MATIPRRLALLERDRLRRGVAPIVILRLPLSAEDEAAAAVHRKRGSIVVCMTDTDMRL